MKRTVIYLGLAAFILQPFADAEAAEDYTVWGFRKNEDGTWATYSDGSRWVYIVDDGRLWQLDPSDPDDDCDYFHAGQNCGVPSHKPGTVDWMEHWHVKRSGWPTRGHPGPPPLEAAEITQDECAANYCVWVHCMGVGPEGYHEAGCYAPYDTDTVRAWGTSGADFNYNCHGYAFDKDGLSQFKLLINDSTSGAGRVIAAYYDQFQPGSESMAGDIMFLSYHTNYIEEDSGAGCGFKAKKVLFKQRTSQPFSFYYGGAGRPHNRTWHMWTPYYFKRK